MNARNVFCRVRGLAAVLVVVSATLSGVAVVGCGNHDRVTDADPMPALARDPDIAEESSRSQSYLYAPDNPFTVATVRRLLDRSDVDAMIASFEGRGMQLAPSDCLVIEGVDGSGITRLTFIGLTPRSLRMDEIGILACFERDGTTAIAPVVLTSTPSRRGGRYLKLADDVWMDTAPMPLPDPSSEEAARWNPDQWNQFWQCTLTYAPGPVSACFVGCFFAGPGYLQCAVACVSTQALSVVVRCATRVMMGGWAGGHDRAVE